MNRVTLAAILAATTIVSAHAANFTGEVWPNTPAGGNVALAPTGEHATFGVDALNGGVNTSPATYTVSDFLATFPGFTGFSNQTAGFDPNAVLSTNAAGTNPGAFFRFTGSVALAPGPNVFEAEHDDGLRLLLAGFGTVLDSPGPTSPRADTFTVNNVGGVSSAVLTALYGECCGPPAVLDANFQAVSPPRAVSEPGSAGLLLAGMVGLVTVARRRKPQVGGAAAC